MIDSQYVWFTIGYFFSMKIVFRAAKELRIVVFRQCRAIYAHDYGVSRNSICSTMLHIVYVFEICIIQSIQWDNNDILIVSVTDTIQMSC